MLWVASTIPSVMPVCPSFIYYPGKKAKAAIRVPFSLLHGDNATTTSSTTSHQPETDVIDINHHSLDFDIGKPASTYEQDVFANSRSSQHNLTSPHVELDIDLSPNVLSDWLEAFSGMEGKQEAVVPQCGRDCLVRTTRVSWMSDLES